MRKLTQATESKCGVAPVTALLTLLVLSTVTTVVVFPFQTGVSNNLLTQRPPVTRVPRKRPVRPAPIFNYGLFATGTGCGVIGLSSLSPQGIVDSWDSSKGTYALTKTTTGGDIGANGGANLSGSFNVYGSLSTPLADQDTHACSDAAPNALNDTSTGDFQGGKIKLAESPTFDNPPTITDPVPTTSYTVSMATCGTTIPTCHRVGTVYTLDPGSYGNLTLFGASNRF